MTALITFILTSVLIITLFIVKHIETKRGSTLFLSKYREALDIDILRFEQRCSSKCTLQYLVSVLRHLYNTMTHEFAKLTAGMAKRIEWRARSVAHKSAKAKQNGEPIRENGYLKEVEEHKNSLDTSEVAERTRL
jgi:hypothetical protein